MTENEKKQRDHLEWMHGWTEGRMDGRVKVWERLKNGIITMGE